MARRFVVAGMPVTVVDLLEAIDVEDQQAAVVTMAARACEFGLQAVAEVPAGRAAVQVVDLAQLVEMLVQFAQRLVGCLGDLGERAAGSRRPAIPI